MVLKYGHIMDILAIFTAMPEQKAFVLYSRLHTQEVRQISSSDKLSLVVHIPEGDVPLNVTVLLSPTRWIMFGVSQFLRGYGNGRWT